MLMVLSDNSNQNWGVFVYHEGSERVLYTMLVEYPEIAPRETVINSFDGAFRVLVGEDGTLYTYPVNRKNL